MSNLKLANNAVSRLSSGISAVATSVSITPGDGVKYPALGAGEYFPATFIRSSDYAVEIVKVTARASDLLTIVRAQEGTAGLTLIAGDRIDVRLTAGTFTDEIARVEAIAAAALPKAGGVMTGDLTMGAGTKIVMEGTTDDAFGTTIDPGEPTADRTLELPDASGTLATLEDVNGAHTMTGDLTMGAGTKIVMEGTTDDNFEVSIVPGDPTADRVLTLPDVSGMLATIELAKWISKGIGEYYIVDDSIPGVDIPPTDSPFFRYAKLTSGLDGPGEYNEGILTTESVTGVAPLVIATAVVSLVGSPMNGQTIDLLNTEARVLRAGTSPGSKLQDAFQDHRHRMTNIFNNTVGSLVGGGTIGGVATQSSDDGVYVPATLGGVARSANETRAKSLTVTVYQRIL